MSHRKVRARARSLALFVGTKRPSIPARWRYRARHHRDPSPTARRSSSNSSELRNPQFHPRAGRSRPAQRPLQPQHLSAGAPLLRQIQRQIDLRTLRGVSADTDAGPRPPRSGAHVHRYCPIVRRACGTGTGVENGGRDACAEDLLKLARRLEEARTLGRSERRTPAPARPSAAVVARGRKGRVGREHRRKVGCGCRCR